MKKYFLVKVFSLLSIIFNLQVPCLIAQVPNGNFEEWEYLDSVENPLHWETNNYYVGFTPIAKTAAAIEGNYSMNVSSTAKDVWGTATGYGCAHVKFVPTEYYYSLLALVKVDSVDTNGEVSIRVKQRVNATGLFEKIGTWMQTFASDGVKQIILPIHQIDLDTILIEIWAKNHFDPITYHIGHTEMIVDKLQLSTTVAVIDSINDKDFPFSVSPNPTSNLLNICFSNEEVISGEVFVLNNIGQKMMIQIMEIKPSTVVALNVEHLPEGQYLLAFRNAAGKVFRMRFLKIR